MVLSPSEEEGGEPSIRAISDAALRGAASARGPDDAEDAAQDALTEMIASETEYKNPVAFAYRAGRLRGIDDGRRAATRKRTAERAGASLRSEEAVTSAEDVVLARLYMKALMDRARLDLTPNQYASLVALYYDGGTISEAARYLASRTGRSAETIRTQLRRSVQKLRDADEEYL